MAAIAAYTGAMRILLPMALVALTGCTTVYAPGTPPVTTLDTPLGTSYVIGAPARQPVVEPPLVVPRGDTLPPPGGAAGRWHGWATAADGKRGLCPLEAEVNDVFVRGSVVQFGSLRGRIGPDGHVSIARGPASITGEFRGTHFQGQRVTPDCVYLLTLDKV